MIQLAILLALLPAAGVEPAQVPAKGRQAAILTVERAGMVRLQAKGGDGTACVLVDQLRGPFASAGAVGREDCALDVLLDVGRYKVRLESPERGKAKGPVTLSARLFPEASASTVTLAPGRPVEQQLPEGSQASFWLRVRERGPVTVRVAGRTAGAVHLWRGGEWREALQPLHLQHEPAAGQPIHEWWLQGVLEPGDYQVAAYGTAPLRFTRGAETTTVSAELGFATSAERTYRTTLGPTGVAMVATDRASLTALLTAETPGAGRIRLSAHPLRDDGSRLQEEEANCVVEPKTQATECAVRLREGRHLLLVRGPTGAAVQLRWMPRRSAAALVDGEYADAVQRLPMEPVAPGDYLIGVHDVPGDADASPLGCALERQPERGGPREVVAWDAPKVSGERGYQRAFNYRSYEAVWFEVTERGEYTVSAAGGRQSECALGRVLADGMERLGEGSGQACSITRRLSPGLHLLKLSGGTEGVEKVTISGGRKPAQDTPARTSCAFQARLDAGFRYTVVASRSGRVAARGLVARRLPLSLDAPLPVEVPAGETLRLPLAGGGQVRVLTPAGAPAGCHLAKGGAGAWREGACWLDARGPDELALAAPAGAPLLAWLSRPPPTRPAEPVRPIDPARPDLPALTRGEPVRLDLEPGQVRALTFTVDEAGLYDVGTEGLLRTSCAIRTPALAEVASDSAGGRGRNCQVSAFLRPGRYLVSVQAEAPSRGRAGVALVRRAARDLDRLAGEGERFFRSEAGELVRQRIAIPRAGRWRLGASALGATLRCRLEDQDGWPLEPVPGPCQADQELPAGEVLWTQLPLTVESMRRVSAAPARPPVVLRGGKAPAPLQAWRRYDAELGKAGRDEFRFDLAAEADVAILLTNGMLGRLHREGEPQPIELIPPLDQAEPPAAVAEAGEPPPAVEPAEEAVVGDGDAPFDGEAPAMDATAEAPVEAAPTPRRAAAPPRPEPLSAPPGHLIHLPAGAYRLVAEHARGDVAIAYQVQVSVTPLLPGVERDLPVPSRVPLRVPAAGTLRLRTTGESDVRCRLFDAAGRLVAQSSEVGDDWNCGLAEPVAAGDYQLEIESETVEPGTTRLAVAQPPPADAGPLAGGKRYALAAGVLAAALPPPAGDAVLEAALEAPAPFSCAVDDEAGRLVARSGPATSCRFLLLPAGRAYRLRAWTLDRPTEVTARLRTRPVAELSGGRLAEGDAARARVARPGTYRTAEGVRCLQAASGLLEPCGPEVALEAGAVVLAAAGARQVTLDELVVEVGAGEERPLPLGARPLLQRLRSGGAAVHLVAVTVPPGERRVPTCRFDGGVQAPGATGCFAASSPGGESLLRVASAEPVDARAWRAAVAVPRARAWGTGRHRLEVPAEGAALELPSGPVRAELSLPPRAWAVLLAGGRAVDLCPPAPALARCALDAADGGVLLVVPAADRHLEAVITALPAAAPPRELTGLRELTAPLPGLDRWRVPSAPAERRLSVEGATGCALALDDGTRLTGCQVLVPPGAAGHLVVEHAAGPLRLLLAPPGDLSLLAGVPPSGSPSRLAAGEAAALQGALLDRAIELGAPTMVHVRAERGTCALLTGGQVVAAAGLGEGCRLDRLLPRGTHRLVVRAFGGAALGGSASWTSSLVEPVVEGVNPERWLAPGDAQLYRFTVAARGRIGVGLREEAETLACAVLDEGGRTLGEGCQQLLALDAGSYLLSVRAPATAAPARFRPVLLGLAGADAGVPDDYLRDLFQRIGGTK